MTPTSTSRVDTLIAGDWAAFWAETAIAANPDASRRREVETRGTKGTILLLWYVVIKRTEKSPLG
jgi:hypothetical protein